MKAKKTKHFEIKAIPDEKGSIAIATEKELEDILIFFTGCTARKITNSIIKKVVKRSLEHWYIK